MFSDRAIDPHVDLQIIHSNTIAKHDSDIITLSDIRECYKRISPYIHKTPVLTCSSMDNQQFKIFLKCENLQKIGAFKIRGALNAVISLPEDVKIVTTHSSGNHAQAIALACKMLNFSKNAVIVMPKDSPKVKVEAVRDSYGAEVRFCEPNQKARESMCEEVKKEYTEKLKVNNGSEDSESDCCPVRLIHPYDDPKVVTGQGTVVLEFLEQMMQEKDQQDQVLDAIVIAVGGGGLLSGCALAAKQWCKEKFNDKNRIKIIAAEPMNANDCWRSFNHNDSLEPGNTTIGKFSDIKQINTTPPITIADSVKTNMGDFTYPIIKHYVDYVIQVSEEEIKKAMRLTMERAKLVIEPGAAVAVAAAVVSPELRKRFPEVRNVGVVLCGGNLDLENIPNLVA